MCLGSQTRFKASASAKCSGALVPLYIRNMQGPVAVLGSRTLHAPAVPLGCVQCVQLCTVPRGSAGSPLPPPDSSGRARGTSTTDHGSFSGYSARGCRFRFSFLSVFGPARAVRRPSTAPRRGRVEDEVTTAISNHAEPSRRSRSPSTGPGIARIRVWPYTGYACISYRHLSSVHGRLSHDGPSHF